MIAEDGVVVDLVGGQASVAGAVPCGYVYVDGLTVGEVTESQLKDRRILGEEGFVSIVIVVDANSGKMVACSCEIYARGSGIDDASFAEALRKIEAGRLWPPPTESSTLIRSASSPAASSASGSATTTAAAHDHPLVIEA